MKFYGSEAIADFEGLGGFLRIEFSAENTPSADCALVLTPSRVVGLAVSHCQSGAVARPGYAYHLVLCGRSSVSFSLALCTRTPIILNVLLPSVISNSLDLVYGLLCGPVRLAEVIVSLQFLPHLNLSALFLPEHLVVVEGSRSEVGLQQLTQLWVDRGKPFSESILIILRWLVRPSRLVLVLIVLIVFVIAAHTSVNHLVSLDLQYSSTLG